MKISASKKQLAKIISENGGWLDGCDFVVQDKDSFVCFYEGKPTRCGDSWEDKGDCQYMCGFSQDGTIQNWHQTILSRDEYYHLYPAQDDEGWIEWEGGECPVHSHRVDVKFREGSADDQLAHTLDWSVYGDNDDGDIIAYRLHKPEPEVETPKPERVVIEQKPTLEQLAAEYRNRKDYAECKQREADEAKAEAGAALSRLIIACADFGLEIKPKGKLESSGASVIDKLQDKASELAGSELNITDWVDLRVDDLVEVTSVHAKNNSEYYQHVIGKFARVVNVGDVRYQGLTVRLIDGNEEYYIDGFKFIRRPAKEANHA